MADADLVQGLGNYKKMWYGGGCSQPENRLEKAEHPERTCRKRSQERSFSAWSPKLDIFSPELFPIYSLIPSYQINKPIHLTIKVPIKNKLTTLARVSRTRTPKLEYRFYFCMPFTPWLNFTL